MSVNETESSPTPSYHVERDGQMLAEGVDQTVALDVFDDVLPAISREGGSVKVVRDDGAPVASYRRKPC